MFCVATSFRSTRPLRIVSEHRFCGRSGPGARRGHPMAATFEARFQATADTPFECYFQHPHLPPPGPRKMYEWSQVNQCWQCRPCDKLVCHGHLESAKHKRSLHGEMLALEGYASAATATTSGAALTNRPWEPVPAAPAPPPGLPTAGLGTQPHAPSLLPDWRSVYIAYQIPESPM
jgi:hypothetical protein